MPRVRIIADNACDLPRSLIEEHDIAIVPLDVRLGDVPAEELRGVSAEGFWELARRSPALAETSAPSPGAFSDAYSRAAEEGYSGAVCVTISSRLSATHQAALAGATGAPPGFPVIVVDTLSVTLGEGLLVLEAADLAAGGSDAESIAAAITEMREKVSVFGTLDTLEYLKRGGRIGSAAAFLGSLLSIKPVIEVRGGVVEAESRQRTRARSFDYLASKVAAAGPLQRLAVCHADADDVSDMLARLASIFPSNETIATYIGPVIGAHSGPGTIGVCYLRR